MKRLGLALILLAGCGQSGTPKLSVVGMDLAEGVAPLQFRLEVANSGDAPAVVDRLAYTFAKRSVLSPSPRSSRIPGSLKVYIEMRRDGVPMGPDDTVTINPRETAAIDGAILWPVADDAPPMVVLASGAFQVCNGPNVFAESPPMALVMQSHNGGIEMAAGTAEQRSELRRVIAELPGERSEGLARLVDELGDE